MLRMESRFLDVQFGFSLLDGPNVGQLSSIITSSLSGQSFEFNISSLNLVLIFHVMLIRALG